MLAHFRDEVYCAVAVAGALVVAVPALAGAQGRDSPTPSCTDTWVGGVDDNFGTAGNWSAGHVPGDSDDVCITEPTSGGDTYTVIANGTFAVHSLTLGG